MSPTTTANITIRPRHPSDLPSCASLLARVHAKDRYPIQGISHAIEFLSSADTIASWVAVAEREAETTINENPTPLEEEEGEEEGKKTSHATTKPEPPRILAHISLTSPPPNSTDPAVVLWRSQQQEHPESQPEPYPEPVAVLERLFVDPNARGQGLAEDLIRVVSSAAGERGQRCVLFALVKDAGAMRLYERVGWRVFGRGVYRYGYEEEGEGEGREMEMEAVCFVAPGSDGGAVVGREGR